MSQDIGTYGFGPNAGDAPGRQIAPGDLGFPHPPGTQGIAESGAEGDGSAVAGNELRPATRPESKITCFQVVHRPLSSQGGKKKTNQSHIVVKRQPRNTTVIVTYLEPETTDSLEIGHQGALRDHRAAGRAGAAGRILDIRQFSRSQGIRVMLRRRQTGKIVRGADKHKLLISHRLLEKGQKFRR